MIKNKLNNIKYITIGLVLGLGLTNINSVASGVEQLLNVTKANYPIVVNGNKLDTVVLNMDGRSYLNLRDIAKATGTKVEWDDKLKIVNIGSVVVQNDEVKPMGGGEEIVPQTSKIDDYIYFRDIMNKNPTYIFDWDVKHSLCFFEYNTEFKNGNRDNAILSNIPHTTINGRLYILKAYYNSTLVNYLK